MIRLDRETLDYHHRHCHDQVILDQELNEVKPAIHGDLNFPLPSNLRNGSLDESFEAKVGTAISYYTFQVSLLTVFLIGFTNTNIQQK